MMREESNAPTRTSTKKMKLSKHLLDGTYAVLNQAKLSKDVIHSVTLRFRDKTIEEKFLQEHAIANERTVYVGYFLQLFLGALGMLVSKMMIKAYKLDACARVEDIGEEVLCHKMLGNHFVSEDMKESLRNSNSTLAKNILEDAINKGNNDQIGFDISEWFSSKNSSYLMKTEDLESQASVLIGMLWLMLVCLLGTIVHWRLHWKKPPEIQSEQSQPPKTSWMSVFMSKKKRREKRERHCGVCCQNHGTEVVKKAWATRAACVVYTVELVGFCLLCLLIHSFDAFWILTLYLWYTFVLLLGVWFTGMLFWHTVTVCFFATVAFYSTSLPVVSHYRVVVRGGLDSLEEIEPIFEVTVYTAIALLNLLFTTLVILSAYANETTARRSFLQTFMIYYQQDKMIKDKSDFEEMRKQMLEKILPPFVVEELTASHLRLSATSAAPARLRALSRRHDSVSILFADVVGFSSFAKQVDASFVMQYLNNLFQAFDDLTEIHDVYKVETIGDCYVATVGLVTGQMLCSSMPESSFTSSFHIGSMKSSGTYPKSTLSNSMVRQESFPESKSSTGPGSTKHRRHSLSSQDLAHRLKSLGPNDTRKTNNLEEDVLDAGRENTVKMLRFAKAMIAHCATVQQRLGDASTATSMRIGVHTGPCLSGIVGARNVRFCLLGETVTIASKFEQTGSADKIHASDIVQTLTPEEDWKESTGQAFRGRTIQDYLLDCKK